MIRSSLNRNRNEGRSEIYFDRHLATACNIIRITQLSVGVIAPAPDGVVVGDGAGVLVAGRDAIGEVGGGDSDRCGDGGTVRENEGEACKREDNPQ